MSEVQQAVDTLARAALWNAYEDWLEDAWEKYFPEIGQYDYDRIVACMEAQLPPDVSSAEFGVAYKVIADRAETTT